MPIVYSREVKPNHLATIRYEMDMLEFCYARLAENLGAWKSERDGWVYLEAYLVHYRNLVEFFGGEPGLNSANPNAWSPRELTPEEIASISDGNLRDKYRGPISTYLQHVTPNRAETDRSWNIEEMRTDIAPFVQRFRELFR